MVIDCFAATMLPSRPALVRGVPGFIVYRSRQVQRRTGDGTSKANSRGAQKPRPIERGGLALPLRQTCSARFVVRAIGSAGSGGRERQAVIGV